MSEVVLLAEWAVHESLAPLVWWSWGIKVTVRSVKSLEGDVVKVLSKYFGLHRTYKELTVRLGRVI